MDQLTSLSTGPPLSDETISVSASPALKTKSRQSKVKLRSSSDDFPVFKIIRKLLRPKVFEINSILTDKGMKIILLKGATRHVFELSFPQEVWDKFPLSYKKMMQDNLALLSTVELGIMLKTKKIKYDTPLPIFKSFFMELMLKGILSSQDANYSKVMEYITRLCNLEMNFKGVSVSIDPWLGHSSEESINTLTFGKESLVSFGLAQEIGLNPIPVTIIEPDGDVVYRNIRYRTFENKHKLKLTEEFEKEFNTKVYKVFNGLGEIRDYMVWDLDNTDLGWSNQLTEYLFYLLPFANLLNHKYIVYGNENSCDSYFFNKDGFKCHVVYDQSSEWMMHMNSMLRTLTNKEVCATSLVQPLHEIAVIKILYQRYPHLARYQMSCHADNDGAEHSRWCNNCSKCARCFIFMKALGFDPASVGLKDMLGGQYRDLYPLLSQRLDDLRAYDSVGVGKDEQLFAFWLAHKRGATGELIDIFLKEHAEEAAKREEELYNLFFKIQRPLNIPASLWRKIKPIYEEELKKDTLSEIKEVKKDEKKEESVKAEEKKHEETKNGNISEKKESKSEEASKEK